MKVILKQNDLNYFVCNILPLLENADDICIHRSEGFRYVLSMKDEGAEQVKDDCLARLMEIGLQPDHEPNTEGILLETLADCFNPAQ